MKNDTPINDLISLEYHGQPVSLGRMDSYQVATRIIAFSDYLGIVTKNTFSDKVELRTEIQGIRGESFDIDFYLSIAAYSSQTLSFINSPLGFKDYFEYIKETIKLWRHLKGSSPKEVTQQNNNNVKIENIHGQTIYATNSVVNIISDNKAGKAAEQFISKPLEEGLSSLEIKSPSLSDSTQIVKEEASFFKAIEFKKPLMETDMEMWLQIESPTFIEGNKWKFYGGQNSWFADIQDETFLSQVNQGIERFGKGDMLHAKVRISQSTSIATLKLERSIVKVIDHIIPPRQDNLFKKA